MISKSVQLARKEKVVPIGTAFFFSCSARRRARTHSRGTVRWTVPATSSKTGGYLNFCLRQKCISRPVSQNIPPVFITNTRGHYNNICKPEINPSACTLRWLLSHLSAPVRPFDCTHRWISPPGRCRRRGAAAQRTRCSWAFPG